MFSGGIQKRKSFYWLTVFFTTIQYERDESNESAFSARSVL